MLNGPEQKSTGQFWDWMLIHLDHDPRSCTTHGHIVILCENGEYRCGPGGYWPHLRKGVIYQKGGTSIQGQLIRSNY